MPSINYFDRKYQKEVPVAHTFFGIGDDGSLAFTTLEKDKMVAEVTNKECRRIQFTPIDHNIVVVENGDERSQCDGMLYVDATKELVFVELKTGGKDWIQDAISQLESTIVHFSANHVWSDYKKRSAYAANNKRPVFQHSNREQAEAFRCHTHFRLYITNQIVVK